MEVVDEEREDGESKEEGHGVEDQSPLQRNHLGADGDNGGGDGVEAAIVHGVGVGRGGGCLDGVQDEGVQADGTGDSDC